MNFKQHRNYGLTIALLASIGYCLFFTGLYFYQSGTAAFSWKLLGYCLFLFAITFGGSQFPDLDTDSIPSRWVARGLVLYWIPLLLPDIINEHLLLQYELTWQPVAILSFIYIFAKTDKHRGITHALALVPALLITSIYTENHFIGAFAVGLGVHYYCDSINPLRLRNWF